MRRRSRVKKYLSNKVLLKEIHNSKLTYCQFDDPKYHSYDIIIEDDKITAKLLKQGRQARAHRLNEEQGDKLFEGGMTNKQVSEWIAENGVTEKEINDSDVVFRRMTNDHIPDTTNKKGDTVKVKINFPPFQHIIIKDGQEQIVGRSHWHKGKFSKSHGKISDGLAEAFLKLVNKYGNRSNWRGYTWLEEMKGAALVRLSQVALQFNEAKSENPFSWYTTVVNRSFTSVLNGEKDQQKLQRSVMMEMPSRLSNFDFQPSFGDQAEQDMKRFYEDNDLERPDYVTNKPLNPWQRKAAAAKTPTESKDTKK